MSINQCSSFAKPLFHTNCLPTPLISALLTISACTTDAEESSERPTTVESKASNLKNVCIPSPKLNARHHRSLKNLMIPYTNLEFNGMRVLETQKHSTSQDVKDKKISKLNRRPMCVILQNKSLNAILEIFFTELRALGYYQRTKLHCRVVAIRRALTLPRQLLPSALSG